jgi:hypothetical protein
MLNNIVYVKVYDRMAGNADSHWCMLTFTDHFGECFNVINFFNYLTMRIFTNVC